MTIDNILIITAFLIVCFLVYRIISKKIRISRLKIDKINDSEDVKNLKKLYNILNYADLDVYKYDFGLCNLISENFRDYETEERLLFIIANYKNKYAEKSLEWWSLMGYYFDPKNKSKRLSFLEKVIKEESKKPTRRYDTESETT